MMISPVKSASQGKAKSKSISAPLKGLHLASPLTVTPPGYGLRLENLVCRTDGLHVRLGAAVITSGLDGPVTTLMGYPSHVVAATTTSGPPWQWTLMSNAGATFLLAVNGTSLLRVYNGTVWQTITLDNLDTTTVGSICTHQSRVWFGSSTDLTLYYLGLDAIAGAVSPVYLQPLCRKGGAIAAIASLTVDGGRNTNDQLLVITTNGEAVLFSGTDPDTSQTWSLGGVWDVPKPIGTRCLVTNGGELAYLSTKGLLPIPQVLAKPDPEKPVQALTEDIWPAFAADTATGAWEMVESSDHEVLIVSGPGRQYVRSSTGAWSTWDVPNATTWLSHNGDLYFGTSDGKICRYGGYSDNGISIPAYLVDRYDRLGSIGLKTTQAVRLLYAAAKPYSPRIKALRNFEPVPTGKIRPESIRGGFDFQAFVLRCRPLYRLRILLSRTLLTGRTTRGPISLGPCSRPIGHALRQPA
jgi:hypothetical protein